MIFLQKSLPLPNSSRTIWTMSSAWVSSLAKMSVLGPRVRPGKISVKSFSLKVRMMVRIWSGATTSRSSCRALGQIVVELLPAFGAGQPLALARRSCPPRRSSRRP